MTANLNWLSDPAIFCVNRLDAHSDHISYASFSSLKGLYYDFHGLDTFAFMNLFLQKTLKIMLYH